MTAANRTVVTFMLPIFAALVLGALIPRQPQLAILILAVLVGTAALAAPPAVWVGMALVAALTFKGLATADVLPTVTTFFDIPLAWGALAVALMSQRRLPIAARLPVGLLAGLGATVAASALFDHSELARPVLYLALLGAPLALIGALLIDPPTAHQRRALEKVLIALLAIQVPLTYYQAAQAGGISDTVQGTLAGAGAGAHVVSGVAVLGIMWLIARRPMRSPYTFTLAALLMPIPFLADAKQVIFALPFTLLVSRWRDFRQIAPRAILVVAAVASLFYFFPAGHLERFLTRAESGEGGKATTFEVVWNSTRHDPASILVGQGPAQTVSRAAFLTTDELLAADSPLRAFGLSPARIAQTAQVESLRSSGGGTSFNTGLSSMIGVFGDVGMFGLALYLALWVVLAARLRSSATSEADAVMAGIVLLLVLGLVFDWWEQPPFTIFLGALVGLALTSPLGHGTEERSTTVTSDKPVC